MFFITEDVPAGEPALMKLHENPFSFHIEHPGRLETIEDVAKELKTEWIPDNTKATEEQLKYVHTKEYIDIMATTQKLSKEELEKFPDVNNFEDIYVNNYTYEAALKAAGCGIKAVEKVLETGKIGFAGLRPPGHHAGPAEASGFCYFNNVAIAAKHLVEKHPGMKRVLIVDWDVHCGQGTQDCIAGDDRIRLVNIFRHEHGTFWPYLKHTGIRTTDPKYRNTVNVPLNSIGFGNSDYLAIMHLVVFPLIKDWQPQFILVSCGFDAAFGDPEGDMRITPLGFAHMARLLSTVRNGDSSIPLAFFFEGGYFLPVVKESFKRLSEAMENEDQLPEMERHAIHNELPATIHRVHQAHRHVYPHFDTLFKLVEKFQKWPSIEEVDKFIGRQPDVVEKDACGKRTEEYENELKGQLSEIAKKESSEGGNRPATVSIEAGEELLFIKDGNKVAFHIPDAALGTLLTSTILLSMNPSQVPDVTSKPPTDSQIEILADFISTHRNDTLLENIPIFSIYMSDEQWVNDELHQILGLSDKTICKFVLSLARKSKSTDDFIDKLQANDALEITPDVRKFAGNLMNRLPRAAPPPKSKPKGPSAAELRTMELTRLNKSLSTVDYKRDAAKKNKNLRQRKESSSEDEAPVKETTNKKKTESDDDDYIKEEEDLDRDIRERDEMAARIRLRDKSKTKNVLDKGGDLPANKDKEGTDVAKIREESRRLYLAKRKEDKIEELERVVMDDETLFANEDLTARERKDMEYRKKILEYAKAHDQADDIMKIKRYHLPDATTNSIPTQYVEETEERGGDAAKWEAEQMLSAMLKYGAKDAKSKAEDFDLLLDDKIDFIQALQMPGKNVEKKEDEEKLSQAQKKKQTIQETRRSLPVYNFREQFIEAVKEHQVLIVEGETGSGKTTQLPQYLFEAGFCKDGKRIGCTQPRRVAAMSVASRVSEEVGTKIGHTVGYSIRFEDCTSDKTMIKYMTDGMLLREFLNEPDLASYSVMMIDEAHERTLHTDILFGLVKDIARFRKDLKLLISSATLDAEKFSTFFDDAPIFRIPGRRFPVDIYYTQAPEADYLDATMVTVMQIHLTQPLPGDILVFLTGQEEIESVMEAIQEKTKALGNKIKELIPLPIYANLPSDMQAKIFDPTPPNARKVVLATNIAETSVTIDGIAYVIDPGFSKLNSFDARSGVEHLHVNPISKAAADQRAGRAGRTGPGKCFRLYTAWAYKHELEDQPTPEIQRTNLGNIVLMLKSLGIHDLVHFDFLDPPPQETLVIALEQLYALGALNHRGELTKLGRRMAEFPTDPQMSKMIIASEKYECTEEIITIAAMLSCNAAVFYRPKAMIIHADSARKAFWDPAGDHLTLMNVYNKWKETNYSQQWCMENFVQHRTMKKARDVRDQLEQLLERVEIEPKSSNDTIAIRKSITAGYFYNCSKLDNTGHYKTVKNKHTVHIHPNSCLFEEMPRWIVYYELVFTSKEFMREICQIESLWLMEVAPHYFKGKELEEAAKKMPKQRGKAAAELHG